MVRTPVLCQETTDMILLRYECRQPNCRQDWECIEGDHPQPETCPECDRVGKLLERLNTDEIDDNE